MDGHTHMNCDLGIALFVNVLEEGGDDNVLIFSDTTSRDVRWGPVQVEQTIADR